MPRRHWIGSCRTRTIHSGELISRYDLILTYGGGEPVVKAYTALGAQACIPIYNALDPSTHYPVAPDPRFAADLGFLGNRMPDREARVEEFLFGAASEAPECHFLLGGNGWDSKPMPANVRYIGHVYTYDHNAFNCSPRAILNINRASMARYGFSPPTRIFEAAGVGACLITDAWEGIECFLEPEHEVIIVHDGESWPCDCVRSRPLGRVPSAPLPVVVYSRSTPIDIGLSSSQLC